MSSDVPKAETKIPSSILIIGSGVFGLSTAWSLCKNPFFKDTSITLIDRQPFPAPDGSSIDSSRIIRPDYASTPYASLGFRAQNLWRTTQGLKDHYHESGLCLTADPWQKDYVTKSLANVQSLGYTPTDISILSTPEAIQRAAGTERPTGTTGYLNKRSGWADAEGAMRWLRSEVSSLNHVSFKTGTVSRLLYTNTRTVSGAKLQDGTTLQADLTILAAGAWTPSLIDLRGIAKSTGQVLAYMPLSAPEQDRIGRNPTILNMSTGMFIIPPSHNILKVARHGHGYVNPTRIPHPEVEGEEIEISIPITAVTDPNQTVPPEGVRACRQFLESTHPSLATRPFTRTRICWYTDTQNGDFLVSYHPRYEGLFVATGGAGHAFKFLPVIGDSVVECVLGRTPEAFRGKWDWPEAKREGDWEGDGSRGGEKGMVLGEEMDKGSKL